MSAPTVFLSAASRDLRSWRDVLHVAFSRAGCQVLTQDQSLRASAGSVLSELRAHIDKSDFVIHLAGIAYGAEPERPPFPDHPDFLCSYTQFEYYYAHTQGKSVIAFVCAEDFPYLDFVEAGDSEPDRRRRLQLQEQHRERVKSGRFHDTPLDSLIDRPKTEPVADVSVLLQSVAAAVGTIRDCSKVHLGEAQQQLESLAAQRHEEMLATLKALPDLIEVRAAERHHRQWATSVLTLCAVLALTAVTWWTYRSLQTSMTESKVQHAVVVPSQTILPDPTSPPPVPDELSERDIGIMSALASYVSEPKELSGPQEYKLWIYPQRDGFAELFRSASFSISYDEAGSEAQEFSVEPSSSVQGVRAFSFAAKAPPSSVTIDITSADGSISASYTYPVDLKEQYRKRLAELNETATRNAQRERDRAAEALKKQKQNFVSNMHCSEFSSGTSVCKLYDRGEELMALLDTVSAGSSEDPDSARMSYSTRGGANKIAFTPSDDPRIYGYYLIPIRLDELVVQVRFNDGELSPARQAEVPSWGVRERGYSMRADEADAPTVVASATGGRYIFGDGGNWTFVPVVGQEVSAVYWSTFPSGNSEAGRKDGFYKIGSVSGRDLGLFNWLQGGEAPSLYLTYVYSDGRKKQYQYTADWEQWFYEIAMENLDFEKIVSCRSNGSRLGNAQVDGQSFVKVSCEIDYRPPPTKMFSRLEWGTDWRHLTPLLEPPRDGLIKAYAKYLERVVDETPSDQRLGFNERLKKNSKAPMSLESFSKIINEDYLDWREPRPSGYGKAILFLMEPAEFLYFRFTPLRGGEPRLIRTVVRN